MYVTCVLVFMEAGRGCWTLWSYSYKLVVSYPMRVLETELWSFGRKQNSYCYDASLPLFFKHRPNKDHLQTRVRLFLTWTYSYGRHIGKEVFVSPPTSVIQHRLPWTHCNLGVVLNFCFSFCQLLSAGFIGMWPHSWLVYMALGMEPQGFVCAR